MNDTRGRGWLVLLPLALLPVARSVGPWPTLQVGLVVGVAVVAWIRAIRAPEASPDDIALLPRSHGRIGAWELALLAFGLAVCVAYVAVAARMSGIVYNDGAYYYGVARHMASTGRFEEPIVWHFLHPPDRIVHAPFDYWGSATALLLAPTLAVFGDSTRVANITMSVVSGAALLSFWYLVCVALPLRHYAAQLLAVVVFALSPALDVYRFQPESIALAHLFLLLALIAFCRGRFVAAILCGFAMLLTRGDGLISFAVIAMAALMQQWRSGGARRLWPLAATLAACIATYSLWSVASFGTLAPPGQQRVPFLANYWQVFDYPAPDERRWMSVAHRFSPDYFDNQLGRALRVLRATPFAPLMDAWLIVGLLPALTRFRGRSPAEPLIWVLCFAGYFLLAWASGPGFAPVRTPYVFAPLIVLTGAMGVDVLFDRLRAWIENGHAWRIRATAVGCGVMALCAVVLSRLPALQGWNKVSNMPRQSELSVLDAVLGGEPVASNVPWFMISHTRSPTVAIPFNGEAAVEAVLQRYAIRWLVIVDPTTGGHSRALLNSIVAGERTQLGTLRFERRPVAGLKGAVFRVTEDKDAG